MPRRNTHESANPAKALALTLTLLIPSILILTSASATQNGVGNVIVPTTEDFGTYGEAPGFQTANASTPINPTDAGQGGLTCIMGSAGSRIGCVSVYNTSGGEYDGDDSTFTEFVNGFTSSDSPSTPSDQLCHPDANWGTTQANRPVSYISYSLPSLPQVDHVRVVSESPVGGTSSTSAYRQCIAVWLKGAYNGTWFRVMHRSGFPLQGVAYTDAVSFDALTVSEARFVTHWNGPSAPEGHTVARLYTLNITGPAVPWRPVVTANANLSSGQNELSWTTPAGNPITSYNVDRYDHHTGTTTTFNVSLATSFQESSTRWKQTYTVWACNSEGCSQATPETLRLPPPPGSASYINVIAPTTESTYSTMQGHQASNLSTLANPNNWDEGGLACEPSSTLGGRVGCVDSMHTTGAEYDEDVATFTMYRNQFTPTDGSGVPAESRCWMDATKGSATGAAREKSYVTYELIGEPIVNHVDMVTEVPSGYYNPNALSKHCSAVWLRGAENSTWWRALLRDNYGAADTQYSDSVDIPDVSISAVRFVTHWTDPIGAPYGWLTTNLYRLNVSSPGYPGAPQNVHAIEALNAVDLSWSAPDSNGTSDVSGFNVYRGTTAGSEVLVTSGGCAGLGITFSCTDGGLTVGQTYYYRISAANDAGEGKRSATVNATPATYPDAPVIVAANGPGVGEIMLNWSAPFDGNSVITGYKVYRSDEPGATAQLESGGCAGIGTANCTDGGLPNDATFYYRVSTITRIGESPLSGEVNATTFRPPAEPRNMSATTQSTGIQLTWQPPIATPSEDGGLPIAAYNLYRGTSSGSLAFLTQISGSLTSYHDPACGVLQTYFYEVSAISLAGEGPASDEDSAVSTTSGNTCTDEYSAAKYAPESPTGNTPFAGMPVKPTWPGRESVPIVNLANGEMVATFGLLQIDEPVGGDFSFDLTYRSMGNANGTPALSYRWASNWFQSLEPSGADFLLHTGDGRGLLFTNTSSGWEGPAGSYLYIVNGSANELEMSNRDGLVRTFSVNNGYSLTSIEDRSGNTWTLGYGATSGHLETIEDPLGRTVALTFDEAPATNPYYQIHGQAILIAVTDFAGRTAQIGYDTQGRINQIRTPGPDNTSTYLTKLTYDANNRVVGIEDPTGYEYMVVAYDVFGRTSAQGNSLGVNHYFHYNYTSGVTRYWDPNGNENEWSFIHPGSPAVRSVPSKHTIFTRDLRTSDPASYVTLLEYNINDEQTAVTFPAGNVVEWTYDEASSSFFSRGNLLEARRSPGPIQTPTLQKTSQTAITTTYEHHATCNKPVQITEARGNDPAYSPPNGGTNTPFRYTTNITYDSACRVAMIEYPIVNPAGLPDPAFTAAYLMQARTEVFTYNGRGQLVAHTDAAGITETRSYYSANASGKPMGHLSTIVQDSGSSSPLALTTAYEYTEFGAVAKVTDPNGNTRTYDVDNRGRTTKETGPAVNVPQTTTMASIETHRTYDANDQMVEIKQTTTPGSSTYARTSMAYDGVGRMAAKTTYPTATLGLATTITYDANGNAISQTDPSGEQTTWQFDERDLVMSQSGPAGGTFAYDPNGNLAARTDANGNTETTQYDGYDRPAVRTDAIGTRFVKSYDPAGQVVHEYAIGGTSGVYLYDRDVALDERGQAYRSREWMQYASTMTANGGTTGRWVTTLTEYDNRGLVTRETNDNGQTTHISYDAAGRRAQILDATANAVTYAYDANGNLVNTTSTTFGSSSPNCPAVCSTTHTYDAENRRLSTVFSDGSIQSAEYDGLGSIVRRVDEEGNERVYGFDLMGRLINETIVVTPTENIITTTHWDASGRVARRCDDLARCTNYTYLPTTRLGVSEAPPTGPIKNTTYDAGGRAVAVQYSSGNSYTITYDVLNRPTLVQSTGSTSIGTTRQQLIYDDLGRITQGIDNGIGLVGIGAAAPTSELPVYQQFDTLGRVISETQAGLTVRHVFDGVGNNVRTTYPTTDQRNVVRTYDANDRLRTVSDTKGLIADYGYEGQRLTLKELGGTPAFPAVITAIGYDDRERPTEMHHTNGGGSTIIRIETRFDKVGNRVAERSLGPEGLGTDAYSQLFELDNLYRSVAWDQGPLSNSSVSSPLDTISSPQSQFAWPSLDGQNNWLTWTVGSKACGRSTGTTGSPPARQVIDGCTDQSLNRTYTYNADGNLVNDGMFTYHWDFLNRLVRVDNADEDLVVAYGYDVFNRRIVKVFAGEDTFIPGVQADEQGIYTYAGQNLIQESQPVGSVLPNTIPPTPPDIHVIRQWTYGPAVDEVLSMDVNEDTDHRSAIDASDSRYVYLRDGLGSPIGLVDQSMNLVEGYVYEPYGGVTILIPASGASSVQWDGSDATSTGTYGVDPTLRAYSPAGNIWYFTGRQYDPEIGSYHYRARQYHPMLGQFMSIDPTGAWGDSLSLGNPYAYVGNNPGSWRDPTGLYGWVDFRDDAGDFGTAVTAFVPCSCTDWARADIRRNYADFHEQSTAPAPLKFAAEAFGPPQSKTEAIFALGLAVVGGPGGKAASATGRAGAAVADDVTRLAVRSADEAAAGARGVDFLVAPKGDVIPVPKGAQGPLPTANKRGKVTGFHFEGGSGGHGLDPRVGTVRVMDATAEYPNGYVVYMNKARQGLNPWTGQTIPNNDPWRHIPLGGK